MRVAFITIAYVFPFARLCCEKIILEIGRALVSYVGPGYCKFPITLSASSSFMGIKNTCPINNRAVENRQSRYDRAELS